MSMKDADLISWAACNMSFRYITKRTHKIQQSWAVVWV